MNKTKIDWADYTWNPVWGCLNSCPYCYARKTAQRFGESFEPHWKEKNFQRAMPKEPSRIFVNSMSDIAYWKLNWFEEVFRKIRENPQHVFLFLTKQPECYTYLDMIAPRNCWFGTTITQNGFPSIPLSEIHTNFISIEPMLEAINLGDRLIPEKPLDWLIIGAETGNRKGKVIPKKEWIDELTRLEIPVFMKDSLIPIWGENLRREFPDARD